MPPLDAAGKSLQTGLNPAFQLFRGYELHRAFIYFAGSTLRSIKPKRLRFLFRQRVQAFQEPLN